MEDFFLFVAVVLVIAYIAFAIYTIFKSNSIGQGIGATAMFATGGCVVVPVATFIATVICWGIAIVIALAIIGFIGSVVSMFS